MIQFYVFKQFIPLILIGLGLVSFIFVAIHLQDINTKEFYETRQIMRESWSCETLQEMIYPTGTWEHREYANSLWIVKECWK